MCWPVSDTLQDPSGGGGDPGLSPLAPPACADAVLPEQREDARIALQGAGGSGPVTEETVAHGDIGRRLVGVSDETKGSVALRVVTGLAAAAAGAGGPVGALVGAGGKEVVDALFETINRRRRERASRVIEISAQASGAAVDRFSETIEGSPALLALLAATVQAAMETPLEEKVYALGGCLGRAAADEAKVDRRGDAARARPRADRQRRGQAHGAAQRGARMDPEGARGHG